MPYQPSPKQEMGFHVSRLNELETTCSTLSFLVAIIVAFTIVAYAVNNRISITAPNRLNIGMKLAMEALLFAYMGFIYTLVKKCFSAPVRQEEDQIHRILWEHPETEADLRQAGGNAIEDKALVARFLGPCK